MGWSENTYNLKIPGSIFLLLMVFVTVACCQSQSNQSVEASTQKIIITGAEQMNLYLPQLKEKNIALVVNHSALIHNTHLVDTLLSHHINIKAVFSPEHGFRGAVEPMDAWIRRRKSRHRVGASILGTGDANRLVGR